MSSRDQKANSIAAPAGTPAGGITLGKHTARSAAATAAAAAAADSKADVKGDEKKMPSAGAAPSPPAATVTPALYSAASCREAARALIPRIPPELLALLLEEYLCFDELANSLLPVSRAADRLVRALRIRWFRIPKFGRQTVAVGLRGPTLSALAIDVCASLRTFEFRSLRV
jgi:hypothetical protein